MLHTDQIKKYGGSVLMVTNGKQQSVAEVQVAVVANAQYYAGRKTKSTIHNRKSDSKG